MTRLLAAWRAAEQALSEHVEASEERTRLCMTVAAFRARYHALFHERVKQFEPYVPFKAYGDPLAWLRPEILRRH